MDDSIGMKARFKAVRNEAKETRASLYHLTNRCNLRCKGCWFFENEFDEATRELDDISRLEARVKDEAARGINAPLLIGGEPALYLDRIEMFRKYMPKVSVSTNGLRRIPYDGFEDVTIAVSVFGGGPMDDELRAIGPNGKRFAGLLDKALDNYRGDERAGFVFAVSIDGIAYIEDTVRRIRDNGNRLLFNYYSSYDVAGPLRRSGEERLLNVLLELRAMYPETIASHPYYLTALMRGKTAWGTFGYDSCPSVSEAHAENVDRFVSGWPALPKFNAYRADMHTLARCCTSGECAKCRDSQAVISWLLVNAKHVLQEDDGLRIWTEVAESYFSQFVWSRYHPRNLSPRASNRAIQ
ncbi:radical SAM protein [Burkholderia multivorans]|uniref:radical SAM protein n=1 Tax=Burkholderia multivorans TaxID=87883 RepID=UPI000CFE9385|nr:radical SAM protein [Burkholderia multivorans]PRE77294.1 radical SAM protein [Burkholderia multivorans]